MRCASARALAAVATLVSIAFGCPARAETPIDTKEQQMTTEQSLSTKQRAIAPIAAATAAGDMWNETRAMLLWTR